ncbi:hypothetical protein BJV77DRAFT_959331 [Russula vinacea]|nr:hypothetical protein BJV77DRAFT_959331 [Russula vinacea]
MHASEQLEAAWDRKVGVPPGMRTNSKTESSSHTRLATQKLRIRAHARAPLRCELPTLIYWPTNFGGAPTSRSGAIAQSTNTKYYLLGLVLQLANWPWSPGLYILLLGLVMRRTTSGVALICRVDWPAPDLAGDNVCLAGMPAHAVGAL